MESKEEKIDKRLITGILISVWLLLIVLPLLVVAIRYCRKKKLGHADVVPLNTVETERGDSLQDDFNTQEIEPVERNRSPLDIEMKNVAETEGLSDK